jgi:hypothetical protein
MMLSTGCGFPIDMVVSPVGAGSHGKHDEESRHTKSDNDCRQHERLRQRIGDSLGYAQYGSGIEMKAATGEKE